MSALTGLALLLLCQSAGELLARATQGWLPGPLPGPVLGLVIAAGLMTSARLRQPMAAAADALLKHLSLLFVPVGVGVVMHLALISQYGLRMVLVVLLSTAVALAVTAWTLQALLLRAESADTLAAGP